QVGTDRREHDHQRAQPRRVWTAVAAPPDDRVRGRLAPGGPGSALAAPEPHRRPLLIWEGSCPFVWIPWLPGTLPITCRPVRYGSLPASHSIGLWLGAAVFGYGLKCRKLSMSSPPPLAAAAAKEPSLLGPSGGSNTVTRCQRPPSAPRLVALATLVKRIDQ